MFICSTNKCLLTYGPSKEKNFLIKLFSNDNIILSTSFLMQLLQECLQKNTSIHISNALGR